MKIEELKKKAKDFDPNKYDGLIVAISCHGLNSNICTSDYKLIEKAAIHRIFTSEYPKVREVPRFDQYIELYIILINL